MTAVRIMEEASNRHESAKVDKMASVSAAVSLNSYKRPWSASGMRSGVPPTAVAMYLCLAQGIGTVFDGGRRQKQVGLHKLVFDRPGIRFSDELNAPFQSFFMDHVGNIAPITAAEQKPAKTGPSENVRPRDMN